MNVSSPPTGVCPVCSSPDVLTPLLEGKDRMLGVPGTFAVAVCASCGAGRTLPLVGDDELAQYYPSRYLTYNPPSGGAFGVAWRLGQTVRWRREFGSWPISLLKEGPGRVLDIGCGRCDIGVQLMARGWEVAGLDPSPQAVEVARSRGVDAHVGVVKDAPFAPGSFDAITMLHSLEHVNDPVGDLKRIHALLKPGGHFIALLPNFGSWQRRRMGTLWFHLDVPRHRTHFTQGSLRLAAERAGFGSVEVDDAFDALALTATLQYRFFDRFVAEGAWRSAAWIGGSQVLSPAIRGLDRLAGESDVLAIAAQRSAVA